MSLSFLLQLYQSHLSLVIRKNKIIIRKLGEFTYTVKVHFYRLQSYLLSLSPISVQDSQSQSLTLAESLFVYSRLLFNSVNNDLSELNRLRRKRQKLFSGVWRSRVIEALNC